MNEDYKTSFLTYYIRSLAERTRDEKAGAKFGFDWIIYNLALAKGHSPHRLPFLRGGSQELSRTKTEPEFGIDLSFLSPDSKTLHIFVLKDEVLNNRNWGAEHFDLDLRNACAPDLTTTELLNVNEVVVYLCYNKDDDRTGIQLFDNLAFAMGTKVGDRASLTIKRWNLTTIVGEVAEHLLSPSLLPQRFFSHFSYICSQFGDFVHGSDEWMLQLIPNWRRFLDQLLSEYADERCVRLLPVALIVLREYGEANKSAESGWIDLIEWGMLGAWRVAEFGDNREVKDVVIQMWVSLYLAELQRYYESHSSELSVQFSLDRPATLGTVEAVASAVIAHWHIGRIGLLGIGLSEVLPRDGAAGNASREDVLNSVTDCLAGLLVANPSASRPLLDIHHIELVLIWWTFCKSKRYRELHNWFHQLIHRLFTRRSGNAGIPFIEGRNSLELIFECVATGERPVEYCDGSSVYLLCLMELICSFRISERNALLETLHRRVVLGRTDDGEQLDGCEPIRLMGWLPPNDWLDSVLDRSLANDGECVTVDLGKEFGAEPNSGDEIAEGIECFVRETRLKRTFEFTQRTPLSVVIMACLKHCSPLPPEIWRAHVFPQGTQKADVMGNN